VELGFTNKHSGQIKSQCGDHHSVTVLVIANYNQNCTNE